MREYRMLNVKSTRLVALPPLSLSRRTSQIFAENKTPLNCTFAD